ncbi:MAG TPA: chloride channel protein, partial [Chitinophagaceae bacterium]|nr:chloride channel protein [Chitinophagaceae bacterium]
MMHKPYKVSIELIKLIFISILIGLLCAVLGYTLKRSTEHIEGLLSGVAGSYRVLYFLLPLSGFALIYLLRQSLFKKKENKGIKEIYDSLQNKKAKLPLYKIPSHCINGFLTVITGGSTGIEVSAVVATATIGSVAHQKAKVHLAFRKELICAATASGVTILFGNPLAGLLFSYEVISKKMGRFYLLSALLATGTTWGFEKLVNDEPLFHISIDGWHLYALPYFILTGIIAGLHSVYLTRCVLFFKNKIGSLQAYWPKVLIGVVLLGCSLLLFPQLYGEGYHGMKELFTLPQQELSLRYPLMMLAGIFLLKPVVTAATLSAGGDGGVFAPSLFAGAFLGLAIALLLNRYFHAGVVPVNFMVIGMAAVLSGCLHAPYTAAFLALGLTDNYVLLVPVLLVSLVAWLTA